MESRSASKHAERGVAFSRVCIQLGNSAVAERVTHLRTAKAMSPRPAMIRTHDNHAAGSSLVAMTPDNAAKITTVSAMATNQVPKNASAVVRGRSVKSSKTAGIIGNGDAAIPMASAAISSMDTSSLHVHTIIRIGHRNHSPPVADFVQS